MRVLFFYRGLNRRDLLPQVQEGTAPDTALRGFNHLVSPGDTFKFLDADDVRNGDSWLTKWMPFQFQPLYLLPRMLSCDVVIASDALLVGWVVSVFSRTRWVYLAINSSVLIRRHAKHPFRLWLLSVMWRSYTKILCISEEQREDFLSLGVHKERLSYVPFGVDTSFFTLPITEDTEPFVASVGRDLGRDYDTLFAAARNVPYEFVIATAPKNIPEGTDIPKNVDVRYGVQAPEVRELYRRASVVAIVLKDDTTVDGSDCTGQTVILEALAAGKAVISTHRRWLGEYLTAGEDYLSIPPNDPAALANAITDLMQNPTKARALARAGQEKVRRLYNTKTHARDLLKELHALA